MSYDYNKWNSKHELLLCCLIRADLNAFWGHETSTVTVNYGNLDQLIKLWEEVGITPAALPALWPYCQEDAFGMNVVGAMLMKLTKPGKHQESYTQFETMRKLRSSFSNLYHASVTSATSTITLGRDTAKSYLTTCPTQSMWFKLFTKGCLKRMGQKVNQDLAISIHLMHALQDVLETEWTQADKPQRVELAMIGAYSVIAFAGSFWGYEVFLVDTFGLLKYGTEERWERWVKFVIILLWGRYKLETSLLCLPR